MSKSQSNLFSILIVVASFVLGYLYYANLDNTVQILTDPALVKKGGLDEFKDLNINFKIIEDERLKSFTVYGENPVIPGPLGPRKDLFSPLP